MQNYEVRIGNDPDWTKNPSTEDGPYQVYNEGKNAAES